MKVLICLMVVLTGCSLGRMFKGDDEIKVEEPSLADSVIDEDDVEILEAEEERQTIKVQSSVEPVRQRFKVTLAHRDCCGLLCRGKKNIMTISREDIGDYIICECKNGKEFRVNRIDAEKGK